MAVTGKNKLVLELYGRRGRPYAGVSVLAKDTQNEAGSPVFVDWMLDVAASGNTAALTGQAETEAQGALGVTVSVALTGQSQTDAQGTLTPQTSSTVALSGQSEAISLGNLTPNVTAPLTGQQQTDTQGSLTPQSDANVALSGQSEAIALGSLTPSITAPLTGQSQADAQGNLTPQASSSVQLSGQSETVAQGTLTPTVAAPVTGQFQTDAQGTLTPQSSASVQLSGQAETVALGALTPTIDAPLSGQAQTDAQGTLTPSVGSTVALSGQSETISLGNLTPSIGTGLVGQAQTEAIGNLTPQSDGTTALSGQSETIALGNLTPNITAALAGQQQADSLGSLGAPAYPINATLAQAIHDPTDAASYTFAPYTFKQGKVYILCVATSSAAAPTPTVISATGSTVSFAPTVAQNDLANVRRTEIWQYVPGATITDTLTVNLSATSTSGDLVLIELDGVDTASPIANSSGAAANSQTSGTVTLPSFASPDNRPLGFITHRVAETSVPGTNLIALDNASHAAPAMGTVTLYSPTVADNTVDASWATASNWVGVAVELRLAGTAPVAAQPANTGGFPSNWEANAPLRLHVERLKRRIEEEEREKAEETAEKAQEQPRPARQKLTLRPKTKGVGAVAVADNTRDIEEMRLYLYLERLEIELQQAEDEAVMAAIAKLL